MFGVPLARSGLTSVRHGHVADIRDISPAVCDAIAEAEAAVVWLHFSVDCGHEPAAWMEEVVGRYDRVIAGLVRMSSKPERWATA